MKQAWSDLKSFITISMTLAMVAILVFNIEVNQAVFALFSTAYGSVITYFFTKKKEGVENVTNTEEENTSEQNNSTE